MSTLRCHVLIKIHFLCVFQIDTIKRGNALAKYVRMGALWGRILASDILLLSRFADYFDTDLPCIRRPEQYSDISASVNRV